MTFSFPKRARLRSRRDYQRLAHGQRKTGDLIVVEFRIWRAGIPRLGITVTKKYGDAHARNRFKRIVREAFRHCQNELPAGIQMNVKPRTAAQAAMSGDVEKELRMLFL